MKVKNGGGERNVKSTTKRIKKAREKKPLKSKSVGKRIEKSKELDASSDEDEVRNMSGEDSGDEEEELVNEDGATHREELMRLKEKDPEFYKFLEKQDADLLNFEESDDEGGSESEDEDENDESDKEESSPKKRSNEEKKRKAPKAKFDEDGRQIFNSRQLVYLQDCFSDDEAVSVGTIRLAIGAFTACVARVGAAIEAPSFVIQDEEIFDATVRLIFIYLGPAIRKLLGEVTEQDHVESKELLEEKRKGTFAGAHKHYPRWKKYHGLAKQYLQLLFQFLGEVQSTEVILATLKTIFPLVVLVSYFTKLTRHLVKTLVTVWTRKTMDCRCMAYIILCALIKANKDTFATIFKSLYLGFVSNSREVNSETWPLLLFMHKTFAEIAMIQPETAYQYAFVYIRQTAIHLRNAVIAKRKDLVQSVYNWQFVQALLIWARVVGAAKAAEGKDVTGVDAIAELAYPLTQITVATLRLFPSQRFLPLRLHCLRILVQLQASCQSYIPTLSLVMDRISELRLILRTRPHLAKGGGVSTGRLDCQLRASAQQLTDAAWRKELIEELFRLALQAAHVVRAQPAFPDLVLPILPQLKEFIHECKNAEAKHLFKSLEDKLKEHSKFVRDQLAQRQIDATNRDSMMIVEYSLSKNDSPIANFYAQWERVWKMRIAALNKTESKKPPKKTNEQIETAAKKEAEKEQNKKQRTAKHEPEGDEEEEEKEERLAKTRRGKKTQVQDVSGLVDTVSDLVVSDDD